MTQAPARSARRSSAARPTPEVPKRGQLPVDSWARLHELTEEHHQAHEDADLN
jgi:hypothetical protein